MREEKLKEKNLYGSDQADGNLDYSLKCFLTLSPHAGNNLFLLNLPRHRHAKVSVLFFLVNGDNH